jgi:hypothetical protein
VPSRAGPLIPVGHAARPEAEDCFFNHRVGGVPAGEEGFGGLSRGCLAARMERQRRLFSRDDLAWFIVDELSLYRLVASPEIMAAQMRRLAEVAACRR